MSEACLCDMAPASFWEGICPKRTKNAVVGFDAKMIGDLLMRQCRNKGAFVISRIRGSGIWRGGQNYRKPSWACPAKPRLHLYPLWRFAGIRIRQPDGYEGG